MIPIPGPRAAKKKGGGLQGQLHLHIPDAHATIHACSAELRALGLAPAEHRDLTVRRLGLEAKLAGHELPDPFP